MESLLGLLWNLARTHHLPIDANSAAAETPILEGQFGENTDAMKERFKTMIPMGHMGKPEEIASAAVFLASEQSSFIWGHQLSLRLES